MRRSIFRKNRIPQKPIRYTLPIQLDADLEVISAITGWSKGELTTVALMRMLRYLVPAWNERYTTQIPNLPSLNLYQNTFKMRDLMESLEKYR